MKRALMTLAAASVLAGALPALAGQPLGWFDERYPFETNKARYAFPSQPERTASPAPAYGRPHGQPYALTGTPPASSEGWRMSVETVGLYPRTIYRR